MTEPAKSRIADRHQGGKSVNGAAANYQLQTFAALIRDRKLSHGAFHLWHALRDYTDSSSRCFPGQRRLMEDLGCNSHSLKPWTDQLIAAGWLKRSGGKGCSFQYTVLDGKGLPLRKVATPTVAESGDTGVAESGNTGVAESGSDPLRKVAAKVSSPVNQAQLSEGSHPRKSHLSLAERISHEGELKRAREELRSLKCSYDDHQAWNNNDRERKKVLSTRIKFLKSALGIVA